MAEYEHIENKQSLGEWKEAVISLAAFATASGGSVRFGVSPTGEPIGVRIGQGSLEDLANKIKINTEPSQFPSIAVEGSEDLAVITVRIEESPVKPVWAFGRPYKRVGRTNQRLTPEETQRLAEVTTGRTWDALPCPGLRTEDLDRREVAEFLRRAGQDTRSSTQAVLETLGLLTPDGINNAAALLFARNPQRFVPVAQVKCARFQGLDSVQFLDQQTIDGNVLAQAEQALAFVARNTTQGIAITGKPERETVPEYPMDAVREAVANAVCHRDYAMAGTVQVRIYDDRLEVWNPGVLPADLTVEALYREHPSRPRNTRLASALYRARLIEHWGTGTLRIVRACEERGMPRPEFSSEMGSFMVRFRKPVAVRLPPGGMGPQARYRQAIVYAGLHGSINRSEYSALGRVSSSQASAELAELVRAGVFVRRGKGRATEYVLATSDRSNE